MLLLIEKNFKNKSLDLIQKVEMKVDQMKVGRAMTITKDPFQREPMKATIRILMKNYQKNKACRKLFKINLILIRIKIRFLR